MAQPNEDKKISDLDPLYSLKDSDILPVVRLGNPDTNNTTYGVLKDSMRSAVPYVATATQGQTVFLSDSIKADNVHNIYLDGFYFASGYTAEDGKVTISEPLNALVKVIIIFK